MDSIMSNIRHKGRASYLTYDKVNEGFVNGEKKVIGKTYAVLNDCALDAVNTICGIVERSQTNLNFELTDNNFYKYIMEDYYVGHSKVHSNGEDEFNEKYGEELARKRCLDKYHHAMNNKLRQFLIEVRHLCAYIERYMEKHGVKYDDLMSVDELKETRFPVYTDN